MNININMNNGTRLFVFLIIGIMFSLASCNDDNDEPDPDTPPVELDVEITRGTVEDIEENVYETVIIGGQEWMAENLRTTMYRDGTPIEYITDAGDWSLNTTGAYGLYHNQISNKEVYGAVYNHHAVANAAHLCPAGWRVPTGTDWAVLEDHLRTVYGLSNHGANVGAVGNRLKSCRQVNSPKGAACNTTIHPRWNFHERHYGFDDFGFAALPMGDRRSDGSYTGNPGAYAHWWSATANGPDEAIARYITYDNASLFSASSNKLNGYAVRCVR